MSCVSEASKLSISNIISNHKHTLNNNNLMEYATYAISSCSTPFHLSSEQIPTSYVKYLGNSCISPVVAARGWGLLSFVAEGKTKKKLIKQLSKLTGNSVDDVHMSLNNVDSRIMGTIVFFADCPKFCLLNEDILYQAFQYYNNRRNSPFQRLAFACDPDGRRSTYYMNHTVKHFSNNRLQYVVQEEMTPNRRAQTALVSAVDCCFLWKHDGQLTIGKWPFEGGTYVFGWSASGFFQHQWSDKGLILRLDSIQQNLNLIIFMPTNEIYIPTASEVFEAGKNIPHVMKDNIQLFLPQFTVATPISLRECSLKGPYPMKRIFDREKSDLSGFLSKCHDFGSVTTLWDHYHKAMFSIAHGRNEDVTYVENGKLIKKKISTRKNVGKKVAKVSLDTSSPILKYYEDHLPSPFAEKVLKDLEPAQGNVVINKPFYFMVVQDINETPLIHCFGRFTNSDAVHNVPNNPKLP